MSQSFTPHRPWTQQIHNRRVQPICLFDTPTRPNTLPDIEPTTPPTSIAPMTALVSSRRLVQTPSLHQEINDKFSDIPALYQLSAEDLVREYNSSSSAGNFAKHLTELPFPELSTKDGLRRFYSYFDGGTKKKNPLDLVRVQYLRRYVVHFYPEVSSSESWKHMVVSKINDALRRPFDATKVQWTFTVYLKSRHFIYICC